MSLTKEYLLFICMDDDPQLDDEALLAFKTDGDRFLKMAEEKNIGTDYTIHDHDEHGESVLTDRQALLILKGMAFDELWAKDDVLMIFRTPDGSITTWEY